MRRKARRVLAGFERDDGLARDADPVGKFGCDQSFSARKTLRRFFIRTAG